MEKVDIRALVSLIAGLSSLMFSFAPDSSLHIATLPLGGLSLVTGVSVLRSGTKGMGISVAGIILATIAVCSWFLIRS